MVLMPQPAANCWQSAMPAADVELFAVCAAQAEAQYPESKRSMFAQGQSSGS